LLRTVSLSNGMSNGPSALLRAMSLSNGRWTFCEAVISRIKEEKGLGYKETPIFKG
jgi:hypothetical protein